MSFIIAFFLLGLLSQASLAKSMEEPIAGCTGICSEPNNSFLDQQVIKQKLINNMETNLKTQQEWVQNLVNVASQEKLKNRQTLEAIESRMARLDSVAHKLHEYPGIERYLDELRVRVEVLEKRIAGQEDTVSTLGEVPLTKRLYNIEKVLLGQQEIIASNNRFADGLSGIKEQFADLQLKHLSEAAKIKERFDAIEKDLPDKQLNIESKGSYLTEVLNGLKNQLAGHETKLINGENKQLDSVNKLEKLQDQLTNQQNNVSRTEAAIKESESKLKILWKNRNVTFQKLGSKYYYFEKNNRLNWADARDRCQELGGHLASLQDQQEFDLVTRDLYKNFYWLDINDIENEGVFMSSTSGKNANFLKWKQAPDNFNGNEDCVEVDYVFSEKLIGMNDLDCSQEHMYICEKKL